MGAEGWLWDEAQPSSEYSHCLQAFLHPPFHTFSFPLLSSHTTQKNPKLHTQAAVTGRTKATSDLQSTGNSKVGKGVNRLFFQDLFLVGHPGYECSSFC